MLLAGCLPDLDGIGFIFGWRFYRTYHRILGHGLPMTLAGPALLAVLGWRLFDLDPVLPLWGWLQAALLAHLFTDVAFYRWPAQLLWPLSRRGFAIGLVAWNDLVPTLLLYGGACVTILFPEAAIPGALTALGGLLVYLAWRLHHPRALSGWSAWLTGDWARGSAPFWRWLTGDFIT